MEMTIEQASEAKIAAESAIRDAINDFMGASGLAVRDIQLHMTDITSMDDRDRRAVCNSVRLRVELL